MNLFIFPNRQKFVSLLYSTVFFSCVVIMGFVPQTLFPKADMCLCYL